MSYMDAYRLRDYLRVVIRDDAKGVAKDWAEKNGLSPAYVSDFLNGKREPGKAMCKALGVRRVTTYEFVK